MSNNTVVLCSLQTFLSLRKTRFSTVCSCVKTAEPIEMPFCPRIHVITRWFYARNAIFKHITDKNIAVTFSTYKWVPSTIFAPTGRPLRRDGRVARPGRDWGYIGSRKHGKRGATGVWSRGPAGSKGTSLGQDQGTKPPNLKALYCTPKREPNIMPSTYAKNV